MKANEQSLAFHVQIFNALQGNEMKLVREGEVLLQKAIGGMCRGRAWKDSLAITQAGKSGGRWKSSKLSERGTHGDLGSVGEQQFQKGCQGAPVAMQIEAKLGEVKVFKVGLAEGLQAKSDCPVVLTLKRPYRHWQEPGLPSCSKTNENTLLGTSGQHGLGRYAQPGRCPR